MPNLTKLVLASIFIAQTFAENYKDPKKEEPPKKEPISYKDEDLWKFCDCFEIRDELGLLDYKYDTKPDSEPDKRPEDPVRRLANYDPYGYNQEPDQYYEEPKKDGCGADCSKSYKEVEDCRAREDYDKKLSRDEEDKKIHEERMRKDSYHNTKYDKEEGARRRKEDQERKDKRAKEDNEERRKRDEEDYQCYGKRPDYAKSGGDKGGDSSSSEENKDNGGDKNGGYSDKDGDKNGGYSDKEPEKYPDYKDPKYNEYGNEQYKDTKYYEEPKKDEKPKEEPKDEKSGGSDSSSSSSSSSSGEKGGSAFEPGKDKETEKDKRKRNRQLKKIYYSLDPWERYDLCYCEWSTSSTFEPKYKDYGKPGDGKNADYNKNSRMHALNEYMHTSGGATVFFTMGGVLLCIVLVSVGYCFYNKRTKESNIEVANLETVVKENSIEMNTVGVTDGEMIEIEA